jgi:uncharacterized membrane protein
MNWAHIHLMFNHVPVIGTAFSLVLLIAGLARGNGALQKAALWGLVGTALVTLLVFFTGNPAEHMVKGVPGVTSGNIHAHEEMAEKSFVVMEIVGLAALICAIAYRRAVALPRWLLVTMLVGSLAVAAMMGITANLGGAIHHPEIGSGATGGSRFDTDDDDDRVYRRDGGRGE